MSKQVEVAIIGAGLAGLACAIELQKNNINFQIFEASDGVGGRVRSDVIDGFILDRGFQLYNPSYPEGKRLLNYDALDLKPFIPGVAIRDNKRLRIVVDPFRAKAFKLNLLKDIPGNPLSYLGLLRYFLSYLVTSDAQIATTKDISASDSLIKSGVRGNLLEKLLRPFLKGVFLESELKTSRKFLDVVLKTFLRGIPSVPAQGMQVISDQLASKLPMEKISLNMKIIKIEGNKLQTENEEIKTLLIERENLISNLLKANKTAATGALSASIAHELNQPLGASQLNIQFLQKKLSEGNLTTEQNQEFLNALLADNQRASNIIQSLRSIFSDGKIGVERIDIVELIESVLKIAQPEIQAQSIQVVLRLESQSFINANRGEIQQVLLNLINNAIQALSDSALSPRVIQIESRDVSEGIQFLVSDNGGGVPLDAQAHLFVLLSSSNKRSGMGLGLWLCHHIVSRHGGHIRYQNAPNGGAEFIVFLPSIQA